MKYNVTVLCADGGRHFLKRFVSSCSLPILRKEASDFMGQGDRVVFPNDGDVSAVEIAASTIRSFEVHPVEENGK